MLLVVLASQSLLLPLFVHLDLLLQICHVFAFFAEKGLPLGVRCCHTCLDLLLNDLACGSEGLIEVFFLLGDLVLQ